MSSRSWLNQPSPGIDPIFDSSERWQGIHPLKQNRFENHSRMVRLPQKG